MIDAPPHDLPSGKREKSRFSPLEGLLSLVGCVLILYFGRPVLIPVTVALFLSFLAAPLVRLGSRLGIARPISIVLALGIPAAVVIGVLTVASAPLIGMAADLPRYQQNIQLKMGALQDGPVARISSMVFAARKMLDSVTNRRNAPTAGESGFETSPGQHERGANLQAAEPIPVEVHAAPPTLAQVSENILQAISKPLESGGVILIVWIFVVADLEGIRDRLIRLAGGDDLRKTTVALDDIGRRLTRYFISQLSVNAASGAAVGLTLWAVGVPAAGVIGIMSGALRFVPYIGIWIAAFIAALLAAAVDPGWGPVLATLGLFITIELIVGQVVEPLLYGHSTGLAPVSVVVAAIFWGAVWGPVGLILSTPLTLCLVVSGRYIKRFEFLEILLGNAPALSLHQQFYQRILAGDADEIIARGRKFLASKSFVEYCDCVILPAIQLALSDAKNGATSQWQRDVASATLVQSIETLDQKAQVWFTSKRPRAVLDFSRTSAAQALRIGRESRQNQLKGSSATATPSRLVVCVGMGSEFDDMAVELMVRSLRTSGYAARTMALTDVPLVAPNLSVIDCMIFLIGVDQLVIEADGQAALSSILQAMPQMPIVTVFNPLFYLELRANISSLKGPMLDAKSFAEAIRALETSPRSEPETAQISA